MASQIHPYAVLGIPHDSSDNEIKKSYRKLALQYHPDRQHGNDENSTHLMQQILEAYKLLSDPEQKSRIDEEIHDWWNNRTTDTIEIDEDQKKRAVRTTTEIDFVNAYYGTQIILQYPRLDPCRACCATGSIEGEVIVCSECKGRGKRFINDFRQVHCSYCGGKGVTIPNPCRVCYGEGRYQSNGARLLDIPAGVRNGETLCIPSAGSAGLRGTAGGHLYVRVEVKHHPIFRRRDDHLILSLPISFVQAVLGDHIKLPFLDGTPYTIEIPAGMPQGLDLRLVGMGFENDGHKGDWIIQTNIVVPQQPSEHIRNVLSQLKNELHPKKEAHSLLQDFWMQQEMRKG